MKSTLILTHFCRHFNRLNISYRKNLIELDSNVVYSDSHRYIRIVDYDKKRKQSRVMNIIKEEFSKVKYNLYEKWLDNLNCSRYSFRICLSHGPSGTFKIILCQRDNRPVDVERKNYLSFCLQKRFIAFTKSIDYKKERNELLQNVIGRHFAHRKDVLDNLNIDISHSYWQRESHRRKIHWRVIKEYLPDVSYSSYNNILCVSEELLLKSIVSYHWKQRLLRLNIAPYVKKWCKGS